jgi:hypothetical protein
MAIVRFIVTRDSRACFGPVKKLGYFEGMLSVREPIGMPVLGRRQKIQAQLTLFSRHARA